MTNHYPNSYVKLLFQAVLLVCLALRIEGRINQAPKLILISFDGFKGDYLHPELTPTMARLAKEGVQTEKMKSVFCSNTFPNHFSIVTGLYEENHGIVQNRMVDSKLKTNFTMPNLEEDWWNDMNVQPIWNVNQDFDSERVSASSMWPGSNGVNYTGKGPKILHKFEMGIPIIQRVDEVVQWLAKDLANFVLLYINEPDKTSHEFGPFSPQVREKLTEVDDAVKHLVTRLKENDLLEETNLIILSDHGMAEIQADRVIDLRKLFESDHFIASGDSPVLNLFFPDQAVFDRVYQKLLKASESSPFRVWRKGEVPAEYHYNTHRRIGQLVVEADEGYEIVLTEEQMDEVRRNLGEDASLQQGMGEVPEPMDILQKFDDFIQRKQKSTVKIWGNHGYNNSNPEMRPLFMANGPAFKKNYEHKTAFLNIDVYTLICSVLQLNLDPRLERKNPTYCRNDGDPSRIREMLNPVQYVPPKKTDEKDQNQGSIWKSILFAALGFIVVAGVAFGTYTIYGHRKRLQEAKGSAA